MNEVNFSEIRDRLSEAALYEGLAEEATELAKEALKVARILRGESPTPVTLGEACSNVREEYTDVELYAAIVGLSVNFEQMMRKSERWVERLKKREK